MLWKLLTLLAVLGTGVAVVIAWRVPDNLSNLLIELVGSFWGFLFAQIGVAIYEAHKGREELLAIMTSVRTELLMNKATVGWIWHLLNTQQEQVDVHGLGFGGTDKISVAATQNLVNSHLTYKFASRAFIAKPLLTIFQTLSVIEREISTANVGISNLTVYQRIKFSEVDKAFDALIQLLDREAERLYGKRRWYGITRAIEAELPRTTVIQQRNEPKIDRILELINGISQRLAALEHKQPVPESEPEKAQRQRCSRCQ